MRSSKVLVCALLAAAVLTGCSTSTATTTTATPVPGYAAPGPHAVGVTTLDLGSAGPVLGERSASVFYPADRSTASGHPRFGYTESETLPAALRSILPARYDDTTTVAGAYVDPPATSTGGPFPVVLFSHGFGGERLYYSTLLAGIASWGYVVVSADYLERGLAAQALKSVVQPTAAQDTAIMQSSLTAALAASADPTSPMRGVADPARVAAVGHSTGGQTAFDALAFPSVQTAVGWAPVGPAGAPSAKPVMLIGAKGDTAVTPSYVAKTFGSFPGPRTLVEISGEGHNTYTDICTGIRSGGGLISFAVANHFVSPKLAQLGINGCQKGDAAPQRFWPIVQLYTVLQLHNVFSGHPTVTVPEPSPGQFPGFTVTVTQKA